MSASPWRQRLPVVAACAVAGALAVPPHPGATPVSAAIAALLGQLGLWLWEWSRLPRPAPRPGGWGRRLAEPVLWLGLGLAVGLLMLGVIRVAIEPALPAIGTRIAAAGGLPVWRRLVIIYTAAVGEELVFRLILLSAIAGTAVRLRPPPSAAPTPAQLWIANVLSALAFAAAHLPSWIGTVPVGAGLAAAVLALNFVAAIVLGHVFGTRGFLAAVSTHAGADCAIQLIGPLTR
jgi:membrane protease YdiL (CAAX protease family)